jgi:hypothetical protein
MQLGAIVFIIPWQELYMFRVLFTPIIRSVLKLYIQLLVQLVQLVQLLVQWSEVGSVQHYSAARSRFLIIL